MKEQRIIDSLNTWNKIAESFHHTRNNTWNICTDYISTLSTNTFCADLGCGNGRHLIPLSTHCQQSIGFDISNNLLSIVKKQLHKNHIQNCSLVKGDLCHLPFLPQTFDHILYIAALHNIKDKKNRIQSLKEIYRVLKKNGSALITVWSKHQDRFKNHSFLKEKAKESGDIIVYWRQHKLNIPRFYHLYELDEFKKDIHSSGLFISELKEASIASKQSVDNYYAIVQKRD